MFYAGMQLSSDISFKSRSSLIKDADYIRRTVNRHFPVVLYTKAAHEYCGKLSGYKNIKNFILKKNEILKEYRKDRHYVKSPFVFYKEIIYCALKEKLGACFELSSLVELALRMNGVKNCTKASLVDSSGKLLNHSVVCIKNSDNLKKSIIIDPWLQDCGFLPEMLSKYKNEYARYLKTPQQGSIVEIKLNPARELTEEQLNYFRAKYPRLLTKPELLLNA